MLYQLSYTHHARHEPGPRARRACTASTIVQVLGGARDHPADRARAPRRRPRRRHTPAWAYAVRCGQRRGSMTCGRASALAVALSGPGLGHEDGLAVVAQLGDRLADVGEGAVAAGLLRGVEVGARVPAAGQLLDRADVDDPVVQVGLELRHVAGEEAAVGGRRCCRRAGPCAARGPTADVVEDDVLGLLEGDPGVELVERPGASCACRGRSRPSARAPRPGA